VPGRALDGAARWAVRHARGVWGALGIFELAGLAAALLAAGGFALIAERVAAGATQRLDAAVVAYLRGLHSPGLDVLALAGAVLGSAAALLVVLAAGTVWLWRSRHRYSVLLLWLSLPGGAILSVVLKATFDRARPPPLDWHYELFGYPLVYPTTPAFPSGHAVLAVVIYATLAYLVARLGATRRMRRLTLALAAVLILLIGASRVYMGVHYPSDVLAGYLAGFVWSTSCACGIEVVRRALGGTRAARHERGLDAGFRPPRDAVRRDRGGGHPRRRA
jgi:undecaprenyl-diphosphatase